MRIPTVPLCGLLAAAALALSLSSPASAAPSAGIRLLREVRAEWDGLPAPIEWEGQRVAWDAPPPSGVRPPDPRPPVQDGGGSSSGIIITNPGWPTVPVTELIASNRVGSVSTRAKAGPWQPTHAASGNSFAQPVSGDLDRRFNQFAEVVDGRGSVLANASGVGVFNSQITANTFQVSGEFSASTLVRPGVAANAHSVVSAQSFAWFRVTERTTFDLAIAMGISDDVRLGFTVMRWSDRTNILAFGRHYMGVGDDEYVLRDYRGTIDPGVYRLAVTAVTRSRLNGKGEVILEGGEATFTTRMEFHGKQASNGWNILDPQAVLTDSIGGLADASDLPQGLSSLRLSATAVPEPASVWAVLLSLTLVRRRRGR